MKLHVTPIYTMLPYFVQKWIMTFWCLKFLRPYWQSRYLILLGSFLYKFAGDDGNAEPKGAPLHVEAIDAHLIDSDYDLGMAVHRTALPDDCTTVIVLSTLRKRQYYSCASRSDALAWLHSLREARHESVTRQMGHAPTGAHPPAWTHCDALGRSLAQSHERVRRRLEVAHREMELSHHTAEGGGGGLRGYFG